MLVKAFERLRAATGHLSVTTEAIVELDIANTFVTAIVVVPVTHPLVIVLTVSRVSPFYRSRIVVKRLSSSSKCRAPRGPPDAAVSRCKATPYRFLRKSRSATRAPQPAGTLRPPDQSFQPAETRPGLLT